MQFLGLKRGGKMQYDIIYVKMMVKRRFKKLYVFIPPNRLNILQSY